MMPDDSSANGTSREVILLFRDLVHQKTGIYFEEEWLDMFIDKIQPLAEAQNSSMMEYYYFLKYDGSHEAWNRVMDALSVQETYFWREANQIETLVNHVVPEWFRKTQQPLRIWSAACASGEEPFSIAMALEEAGWGSHPIEILASDASEAALKKAEAGLYRERSFRSLPPALRDKYFSPAGDRWEVSPELKSRVKFRRANLVVREEVKDFVNSPVIFCRNVFIYFSPDSIRRTVAHFAEGMPDNGYLFVGVSESLLNVTSDFSLREIGESFVYVRSKRDEP